MQIPSAAEIKVFAAPIGKTNSLEIEKQTNKNNNGFDSLRYLSIEF